LAVDGADEVDPDLNLIKGLGRALLREKIVEIHAERFVVIGDHSKRVERLGRGPLPVEIVPFGAGSHVRWLNTLGCRAELWRADDGSPLVTDNGNYLARCWFADGIADAQALARALAERPGIVEHGLFLDMASLAVLAGPDGVRLLERNPVTWPEEF
jgi:ribose 5-phosphate isomerase A